MSSPAPSPRPRSLFVTVLAWLAIIAGGLGIPVSFFSSLMLAAHSYGTASADAAGFLTVVGGPPVALAAGIGLLLRKQWAWLVMLVLIALTALSHAWRLMHSHAGSVATVSPDGVQTTVTSAGPFFELPMLVICAALIWKLRSPSVRAEFAAAMPPPLPAPTKG